MKYVCKCCGSDRIQVRAWIDANTNQAFEWCDDENYHECFCEDCQDLTEWKAIEENTNENTNTMKKEMTITFDIYEGKDGKTYFVEKYKEVESGKNLYRYGFGETDNWTTVCEGLEIRPNLKKMKLIK